MVIMAQYFFFNTHEWNHFNFLFDPILGFGLGKGFWKWIFLSLKK
jgi:hypothetical protein